MRHPPCFSLCRSTLHRRRPIVRCHVGTNGSEQGVTRIRVISLRVECPWREGHNHGYGDLLGGKVCLRRALAAQERVLQEPGSRAHNAEAEVVCVNLLETGTAGHLVAEAEQV